MKNPWMSLWLSGANAWTAAARGQMAADVKKSQNAMAAEMTRQTMAFWMPGAAAAKPAPRKRRTKR